MLGYPQGRLTRSGNLRPHPPVLFNPLVYDCRLWLRTDAVSLVDGAVIVNQLLDKSGNGKHFVAETAQKKYWLYVADVYRGLAGIAYSTTENYVSTNWTTLIGGAARTLFLVYANGANVDTRAWGYGGSAALQFFGFELGVNTHVISTGTVMYTLGARSNDTAPDVLALRYDGTVLTGFLNSGAAAVTQTVALSTLTGQLFRLNASDSFGVFFECILIAGALTDAQMAVAMNALTAQYRNVQ